MNIADQIQQVRLNIQSCCLEYQRNSQEIRLLAVSKTYPLSQIQAAYEAGITEFGESYLQEALHKIKQCQQTAIQWHFIGPLQSNKTRTIAEHFHWVQSLDSEKNLIRLNDQRPLHLPKLQVCLQVNLFAETHKRGIGTDLLPDLLALARQMPNITLRGLMFIPPQQSELNQQIQQFREAAQIYHQYKDEFALDTLSMGMSNDFCAAISAGTTLIRIGQRIFGSREESSSEPAK